jgi:2-methylcitrate synthase
MLGTLEPELDFAQQDAIAERLLASLPSMLCYWYRFALQMPALCGGLGRVKQVSPGG